MFGITMAESGDEFVAPGPNSFDFSSRAVHVGGLGGHQADGPAVLGALVVFVFFYAAPRRATLVPGRLQFAGESAYGMVRNSIGRDIIGSHDSSSSCPTW